MSEPNYESIGRCVVLTGRIYRAAGQMRTIKMVTYVGESICIDLLSSQSFTETSEHYRYLLSEIISLVSEHNKYAQEAEVKRIEVTISGHPINQDGD